MLFCGDGVSTLSTKIGLVLMPALRRGAYISSLSSDGNVDGLDKLTTIAGIFVTQRSRGMAGDDHRLFYYMAYKNQTRA